MKRESTLKDINSFDGEAPGTVVKKKPEAALRATGLYLAMNVFVFGGAYIVRRLFSSSLGHWLEIDKPTHAYVPGSLIVLQIFPLIIAINYYWERVKRDRDKSG